MLRLHPATSLRAVLAAKRQNCHEQLLSPLQTCCSPTIKNAALRHGRPGAQTAEPSRTKHPRRTNSSAHSAYRKPLPSGVPRGFNATPSSPNCMAMPPHLPPSASPLSISLTRPPVPGRGSTGNVRSSFVLILAAILHPNPDP